MSVSRLHSICKGIVKDELLEAFATFGVVSGSTSDECRA
jgi:hypothetical protein